MAHGVLNQNSTVYNPNIPGIATVRKSYFGQSNLRFPIQHCRLIDFAMVESHSIIIINYMFLLPCLCLHVLFLILDCTIK